MRPLSLVFLALTALSGCMSTGLGDRYDRDRDAYRRSPRSYPASARTTRRGQERYVICHNGRTRTVASAYVDAHRRHGDRFGSCARDDREGRRDDRRDNGRGRRRH